MTRKAIAVEIPFHKLVELLRLPSDTNIICVSFQEEDQALRIAMKTEHGVYLHDNGIIPVAPLAKLQIKRLEKEL